MRTRVTLDQKGLVCRKLGSRLRGTFAAYGAILLLVASCSVASKDGYTFGNLGGKGSTTGGDAAGGARSSGGHSGVNAGGSSGLGVGGRAEAGVAGALDTGGVGGSDVDASGGGPVAGSSSLGGGAGLTGSGGAINENGGNSAIAGAGGTDAGDCEGTTCPGGFACANGFCKNSCSALSDCVPGWFCEANDCKLHALDVRLGSSHSCALMSDGTVRCFGSNGSRQLGAATTTPRSSHPITVTGVSGVVQIAAGGEHSCALLTNGSVVCWGSNAQGALGNATLAEGVNSPDPVAVSLPGAAASISPSCAVLKTGALYCWGTNIYSELADSTLGTWSKPVRISGLTAATQVSAGPCVIDNANLYCWGNNGDAQCGSGSMPSTVLTPTLVNGITGPIAVAAGYSHGCAIVSGGAARCWGYNSDGQLGAGTSVDHAWSAVTVQGLSGVASISTGAFHTCASLANGAAFCWGRGSGGELGNGTLLGESTPTPVSGLSNVAGIATGFQHSCAVKKDGTLWCWGAGTEGQIGTLWTNSPSPVQVAF